MDSDKKPTKHQPSSSELLSSAKLVVEAAKSTLSHDNTQQIDKAKLAGAAGNLLEAASHYGKLQDTSYGTYVEKAETYLHQYHPAPTTTTTTTHSTTQDGDSGSGFGDYLKMAQGFMKKN